MSPAFMVNIDSSQEEVTKLAEQIHSVSEDSGHLTERMILLKGKNDAFRAPREDHMKCGEG